MQIFSPYGEFEFLPKGYVGNGTANIDYRIFAGNIHISYCNQTTAWVTLLKQEMAESVVTDLVEAPLKELPVFRKPCTVITWSQYCEKMLPKSSSTISVSRRSAKASSSSTPTPAPHSSSSGGDAETVDLEVRLPAKRSSVSEGVSKKRKKNDQDFSAEYVRIFLSLIGG